MQGNELTDTIHSIATDACTAALLRHAERYKITDPSDPLSAVLMPSGVEAAKAFGRRLHDFDEVRLFHSPVKRCQQTAECIAEGAQAVGLQAQVIGPQTELGVDYIQDLVESGRLTSLYDSHFVRLWFEKKIPETVVLPVVAIAEKKLAMITRFMQEPVRGRRRLDLHVSHDWNILLLRELLLGVRHEDAGWLDFLDGIAFSLTAKGLRAEFRGTQRTRPLPWVLEN